MILAREAGFTDIHSIDIVEHPEILFQYEGVGNAFRYIDDSRNALGPIISKLSGKIMFWLDGHSQLTDAEQDNFPLLDELDIIANHNRKDHIILIDDFLMMTHPDVTGWNKHIIIDAIIKINPEYKWKLLPNPIKNNILVAYV